MNLTISGHHLEVTSALREYVLTKLDRVTRHFDQVVDINVLADGGKTEGEGTKAEGRGHAAREGPDIFVEQSHEDLYAAIDQLMDKLDRQVVPPQGPHCRTTTTRRAKRLDAARPRTCTRRPAVQDSGLRGRFSVARSHEPLLRRSSRCGLSRNIRGVRAARLCTQVPLSIIHALSTCPRQRAMPVGACGPDPST